MTWPSKNLNLIGGEYLLPFHLYKGHSISVNDPDNVSEKEMKLALSSLFGRNAEVVMEKFNAEMKGA